MPCASLAFGVTSGRGGAELLLFKMPVSHQKPNVLTLGVNNPRMGFVICLRRRGGDKRQANAKRR
jgi:hypothetical protein